MDENQFNQILTCQKHKIKVTLACNIIGCSNRNLCKECLETHPLSHFSAIIPFKFETPIVDQYRVRLQNLLTRAIVGKNKIETYQAEIYSLLEKTIRDAELLIITAFNNFKSSMKSSFDDYIVSIKERGKNLTEDIGKEISELNRDIKSIKKKGIGFAHELILTQERISHTILPRLEKTFE